MRKIIIPLFIIFLICPHKMLAVQNDHFDSLLNHPNLHAAHAFRTQEEIDQHTHGVNNFPGRTNIYIRYNPSHDAAELTFLPGDISLFWGQLRPTFQKISKQTGHTEISFQWDARWDASWADLSAVKGDPIIDEDGNEEEGRFDSHKAFQLSNNGSGDKRRYEIQTRFNWVDDSAVAIPTLRQYSSNPRDGDPPFDDNARTGTDSNTFNYQPGGDTAAFSEERSFSASDHVASPLKPFVIRSDKWVRFTVSVTFNGGQRLKIWMADEDTDPVLVLANPHDPNLGFLLDYSEERSGFDNFWFEYNSSQGRINGPTVKSQMRNFLVFKNMTVPFGGRPLPSGGTGHTEPFIVSHPQDQAVTAGDSISFSVTASGQPSPTYQWQKNGVDIPGATQVNYSISSVQQSDAGSYRCVVSNSLASVTSLNALLSVHGAPPPPSGNVFYVDASGGSDSANGTSESTAWQTFAKVENQVNAGDQVLFKRGEVWEDELRVTSDGTNAEPILFGAYGTGANPIFRELDARGDFHIYENIIIDQNKGGIRPVWLRGKNMIFRNMEVKNATVHGVNVDGADNLLIENCHFHHFLAGTFNDLGITDAHGISIDGNTNGVTIRNTEIHHVSGDSLQVDPARSGSDNIVIEDSTFWTGPLANDFNSGWQAGNNPGENAIDTKVTTDGSGYRMNITLRNITAYGWNTNGPPNMSNRAVFNMKEKINAVFDGVTVYDSEIAFRLRGTRGNADTTIMNAVIYDVEKAIRAEDDLANLTAYNNTFGHGIGTMVQFAGGNGGVISWDFKNNLFIGSKPAQASHPSNLLAVNADFENSSQRNYQLVEDSLAVDNGFTLSQVTRDRNGGARPVGSGIDVGAYEYGSIPTNPPGPDPDPDPDPGQGNGSKNLNSGKFQNIFNPYQGGTVSIPCQSVVRIYQQDLEVRVLECGQNGFAEWDGRNSSGEFVTAGVYLVVENGKSVRKIVVIK